MSIKMVRQPSETPNISNIDDIIGLRYAYGNQDGYVIGKGQELDYSINGSNFILRSGRVVLQGVESDIDSNGVTIPVNNISTLEYYTIYYKVNLAANTTSIESQYDTMDYPVIDKGEDLTIEPTGTANLELYHFQVRDGIISNVQKIVNPINYINNNFIKNIKVNDATNSDNSTNSTYALYASQDTSKGTIEERLTALGFKKGAIDFGSSSASSSTLIKSGRLVVIGAEYITLSSSSPSRFYIPKEFAPSTRQTMRMYRTVGLGTYYVYVNTDGSIEFSKAVDPNGLDYFKIDINYWVQ